VSVVTKKPTTADVSKRQTPQNAVRSRFFNNPGRLSEAIEQGKKLGVLKNNLRLGIPELDAFSNEIYL